MTSSLVEQDDPQTPRHLDPSATADAVGSENLLRCWVRETSVPPPTGGTLRLELPASGATVEAPVRHWSAAGWHRFGPVRLNGQVPLAAPALAALLALETAAGDPAAVADLTGRVSDSVRRVARFLQARSAAPQDPAGTTPFLVGEQALVCGHPLHPTPKSREGLSDAEAERYSPELRGSFPLHWFAADAAVVRGDSALRRGAAELVAALGGGAVEAPADTVLIPAHPWQAREILDRPGVARLLAEGALRDVGPGGPAWSPTSSVRTLYRADAAVMLKFSLGLRITNSRRENLRLELERGVEIARLLEAGLGAALRAEHPDFAIVRDPAWLAVEAPDGEPTGLDVVVRDNPFLPQAPGALLGGENPARGHGPAGDPGLTQGQPAAGHRTFCVAGLVSPRPERAPRDTADPAPSLLADTVRNLADRTGRPLADVGREWFARYLERVVRPVLWLYATHGLGLEAHQQNTLVVLDEDGWPVGGRYRDNQGYYFSPERSAALHRWRPGSGRDLGTYVADDVIDERLAYYIGINNVLGLVGAFGSQGLAEERDLLRDADRALADLAAEHGDRLRLATLLRRAPTLRCKANLLTRVRGMDELVGPLEAQSVYVEITNPLAEASR